MSPPPDSTLDDPQQVIADLKRQLAEATAERDENQAQKEAMAEVLGVINASPGDLAPVFDAMVQRAAELCEADEAAVRTFDGSVLHLAATHGPPGTFEELGRLGPSHPNGLYEAIAQGEAVTHIVDVQETEAFRENARARERLELRGIRSWLAVALRKEGALLGIINVHRREVRPFTDKQISLLENFGAQAVIAIENARLITETREALEQQTATAEVLQAINSSPGDLAPVFDAILEKARSLCGAVHGALVVYDGEHFRAVATHGLPEPLKGLLCTPFRANPVHQALLRGERLIHIADQAAVRTDTSIARASVDAGARTLLLVPLRKDGALLGYITASRWEVRPFTDKEIALLENFAAQAVIAMENARLLGDLRERTDGLQESLEHQTATSDVLGVISRSGGELGVVFETLVATAARICEADTAAVMRLQEGRFRLAAAFGVSDEWKDFVHHHPVAPERGTVTGRVALEGRVVHVEDVKSDPEYTLPEAQQIGGFRTALGVPLMHEGHPIGVIALGRFRVEPFTDKQIELVRTFADQAVIAMENARLITETREALEQQTATAEVLQVINSSPGDLAPVFSAMLEKATNLCEAAYGTLFTYDGELFYAVALRGVPAVFADALAAPVRPEPGAALDRLVRGEYFADCADVANEASYRGPAARVLVELGGARSTLAVPLRKDNVLLGAFAIYRQEVRPFSEKQITLLQNFAAQAVIAMENARLLGELRQRTDEVGELNRGLEARVAEQVDELGRVGRLKRFLAPQLAELIVSHGDEKILESHRREIVVVFCDLRGYTAFTETAEPEEVLNFLGEYHGALGPLVSQFEGTLDQFSGDGIMVFFNDPVPCPDPAERAVKMAIAMRSAANTLIAHWRERGRDLGFGAGIAQGYATLGQIGFSERSGYTAIGTVCNVAARLCAEAKDGQILLGQLVNVALKGSVATEQLGPLALKGLSQPVVAYNVPLGAIQPALRVIEGGSPETV